MSAPRPDGWTAASLALLLVLAALLFSPLLGGPLPSPWVVAGVLLARVGVQVLRARTDERLRRPAAWAVDLLLIGLLLSVIAGTPPA